MKVLVLGGSGHIGRRLIEILAATSWVTPVAASRGKSASSAGFESLQLDTLDGPGLTAALYGCDAVVNCVAGNAKSIAEGARLLTSAALAANCPRIIHLSTMSVYGAAEGRIFEDSDLDPVLGWYGKAKIEAEAHMNRFSLQGGEAVLLRPGCVFGPGSELWVGRLGRWLKSGRLGDLGTAGDGWSNLVHVDDVCKAVLAALRIQIDPATTTSFNLAAPDSPRWNEYFTDLALAIDAIPVRRISPSQLRLDALLVSPPIKVAQIALARMGKSLTLPDPISPGLPRLWAQHIQLDSTRATHQLGMDWMPYAAALRSSSDWFCGSVPPAEVAKRNTICTP